MKKFLLLLFLISASIMAQEDCIEIPNGNFQEWSGIDNPVNWITTNMGDKYGTPNINFDLRNVFKTPGKFGNGIRIKNASFLEMLKKEKPQEYAKLPEHIKEQLRKSSFSGSVFTCQGNCESAILSENEVFMRQNMFFSLQAAPGALCGYYKAKLKEGDKFWILPYIAIENGLPAGGVMPGETASVITQNSSDWKPFRIPLRLLPERTPVKALIQMQIVGSGFPVTPPYGMSAVELAKKFPSTDGSEVFIDELCFCGEADYIEPGDPILDEIDLGVSDPNDSSNPINDNGNNEDKDNNLLYVAMDGSDTNSGSNENPFATLQKAMDVANTKRQSGNAVTIIVKDGTYKQAASVSWQNSGLPPLTIKAQNPHDAIFVGSEEISAGITWQNFGPDIYKASQSKLHPNQVEVVTDYTNPYDNSAPALVVNGQTLNYTQAVQQTANSYFISPQLTIVHPMGGVYLSSATVEVSVLSTAIKITGGGTISIKGLRFMGYPVSALPAGTVDFKSGLDVEDNVSISNCLYK